MQQAYRAVLCDGKNLMRVVPAAFNISSQIMQHCQIGNLYVNVAYMLLSRQPMRVCWMGDQAYYPFEPNEDAYASALPEEEFMQYFATAWENTDPHAEIPLNKFSPAALADIMGLHTRDHYLVNHTRMTYLDIGAFIADNQTQGKCYDPLPLLTACGNGRGEQEYPPGKQGSELIGTWASSLIEYTAQLPHGDFVQVTPRFEQPVLLGSLVGKSFVVTGKVPGYTRNEFQSLIEQAGGCVSSSVTRHTNYLVVSEKPGKTKLDAAAKHGTRKISVKELMDMLES